MGRNKKGVLGVKLNLAVVTSGWVVTNRVALTDLKISIEFTTQKATSLSSSLG